MKFLMLSTLSLYLMNCFMSVSSSALDDIEEVCNYNKTTECMEMSVSCNGHYRKECYDFFNVYCKEQDEISDFCYNTGIIEKLDNDDNITTTEPTTTTTAEPTTHILRPTNNGFRNSGTSDNFIIMLLFFIALIFL